MRTYVNIRILFFFLVCLSCSRSAPKIELVEIQNEKLSIIEKGATVNKIREGYWITLSKKKIIVMESYFIKGKQNGPIKMYHDDGKIMSQSYMKDGKENGTRISYYYNGIISDIGTIKNDEKDGKWVSFSKTGQIDKIILYTKGEGVVKVDNHLSVPTP